MNDPHHKTLGRVGRCVIIACMVGAVGGCVETSRVPVKKPFLSGIQGGGFRSLQNAAGAEGEGSAQIVERRVVAADGTITLNAPTASDLMRHMLETLADDEEELFTEQLLSTITKREFHERGYDPVEAFRELSRRQKDVRALFSAMPVGEFTPGVMMKNVDRNTFRLSIKGDPDLRWSFIDVVLERGQYKLRWFGRE